MTLIDYLNRVHFADGILEEALWAELEDEKSRPILVVSDRKHMSGDLADRFRAGLPMRGSFEEFRDSPDVATEEVAAELAQTYQRLNCVALIAFGSGNVMDLAKLVRLLVSHDLPLSAFSITEGGGHRITQQMPKMIAVPTLHGVASGLNGLATVTLRSGNSIDIMHKKMIPSVTICDPTLTVQASPESHASAGVATITRCVEALLSPNYNPPADGMALDGLIRAIKSLHRSTRTGDPEARREMMAAGLNAALVQQNGLGLTYAISGALDAVVPKALDKGAVMRLILPEVMRFHASGEPQIHSSLFGALEVQNGLAAADAIATLFADLPLPDSLADMGIPPEHIRRAAQLAAGHRVLANGPRLAQTSDILAVLQSVQYPKVSV